MHVPNVLLRLHWLGFCWCLDYVHFQLHFFLLRLDKHLYADAGQRFFEIFSDHADGPSPDHRFQLDALDGSAIFDHHRLRPLPFFVFVPRGDRILQC